MEYIVIAIVSASVSLLTLFSGFGLGTILMPVFAIFFPIDLAISLTAIVHLFNNLFKWVMLGRYADRRLVIRFGLPAIVAAFLGAWVLIFLERFTSFYSYSLAGHHFEITFVKIIIAFVMLGFVILEFLPRFKNLSFDAKWIPWGGLLSGFFGGLSGHQGALRSMFLMKCGLSKENFIATGVVTACLVDLSRLSVYSVHFFRGGIKNNLGILLMAIFAAWTGVYIGGKFLKKTTLSFIQSTVSVMVVIISILLASGLI